MIGAYVELAKLRLSALAVFAVLAGICLGAQGVPPLSMTCWCVLGALLVAGGGNALNMLVERDLDARMERTRNRPLPTGRLTPGAVLVFGIGAASVGVVILATKTNWLAASLSMVFCMDAIRSWTSGDARASLRATS